MNDRQEQKTREYVMLKSSILLVLITSFSPFYPFVSSLPCCPFCKYSALYNQLFSLEIAHVPASPYPPNNRNRAKQWHNGDTTIRASRKRVHEPIQKHISHVRTRTTSFSPHAEGAFPKRTKTERIHAEPSPR
jgi:hypothetical protein